MSEAGYTLVEALAAMAVIGLAIGGYGLTVQVMSGQQLGIGREVRRLQRVRAAEVWLERRLDAHGPFRAHEPTSLAGDPLGLQFGCHGVGATRPRACAPRTP